MAGVQDLVNVSQTILNVTKELHELLQGLSTVTIDYESKVDTLRCMMYSYEKVMGMTLSLEQRDLMMKTLDAARVVLEDERKRLRELKDSEGSRSSWNLIAQLSAYYTVMKFPGKLDKQLAKVTSTFNGIAEDVKSATNLTEVMKTWREHKAMLTTTLNNDHLYVPIVESQNAVTAAIEEGIEKPDGKPIKHLVLLHGGVGKGKSTIARYVCWRYGGQGSKAKLFDHVIQVPCGNDTKLDLWAKQSEILQHLEPTSSGYTADKNRSASRNARISYELQQCLRDKKVLIVLDDVADQMFLYEMWKAAQGAKCVKYLVTSQRSDLCGSLTSHSSFIEMANPNGDEARQILAGLVGLKDKKIPRHLEGIASQMIKETDGNPQALGCLASNFAYSRDKENKRAWHDAYKSLSNLLDNPQMNIVLGPNHDSRSVSSWAALESCLKSLETKDAKTILFLIYSCKGESVPEAVLRILYEATSKTSATFFKASAELSSRELLQASPGTLPSATNSNGKDQNEGKLRKEDWSFKFLVRLYMNQRLAGREEIKKDLFGDIGIVQGASVEHNVENARGEEETATESETEDAVESKKKEVVTALCALYFDGAHFDKVVADQAIKASEACHLNKSSDHIKKQIREAIEPMIWLLDQPEDDNWTKCNIRWARQVLLKYVYERKLDGARIVKLLNLASYPSAQLATLIAIADIFSIEETSLPNEKSPEFLEVIVKLLAFKEQLYIREAACNALFNISRKAVKENKKSLVVTPVLLGSLLNSIEVSLLGSEGSYALAANAEEASRELGYSLHFEKTSVSEVPPV